MDDIEQLRQQLAAERERNRNLERLLTEANQQISGLVQPLGVDNTNESVASSMSNSSLMLARSGSNFLIRQDSQRSEISTRTDSTEKVNAKDINRLRSKRLENRSIALHNLSMIPQQLRLGKTEIQLQNRIGKGSFGEVWRGLYRSTPVAVKLFLSEEADVSAEIVLMSRVAGRSHILELVGVVVEQEDKYKQPQVALVTKYMSNGSMHAALVDKESPLYRSNMSHTSLVKMAMQAARGIAELHDMHIIHRDLACRNFLLDEKMDVFVADFGFARVREAAMSKGFTHEPIGPVRWEAPECLIRKEYSERTDVFSFAVCLFEMMFGKEPWENVTTANAAFKVLSGERMTLPLDSDPVIGELMVRGWSHDPRKRPTIRQVVQLLTDRYQQLQQQDREVEREKDVFWLLRKGQVMQKVPFGSGKPRDRTFHVSEDLLRIFWKGASVPGKTATGTKFLWLSDILDIWVGQESANFKRFSDKLPTLPSFSIITSARTLDIICPSSEVHETWILGLRCLVKRLQTSTSLSNAINGTNHLTTDAERMSELTEDAHDAVMKKSLKPASHNQLLSLLGMGKKIDDRGPNLAKNDDDDEGLKATDTQPTTSPPSNSRKKSSRLRQFLPNLTGGSPRRRREDSDDSRSLTSFEDSMSLTATSTGDGPLETREKKDDEARRSPVTPFSVSSGDKILKDGSDVSTVNLDGDFKLREFALNNLNRNSGPDMIFTSQSLEVNVSSERHQYLPEADSSRGTAFAVPKLVLNEGTYLQVASGLHMIPSVTQAILTRLKQDWSLVDKLCRGSHLAKFTASTGHGDCHARFFSVSRNLRSLSWLTEENPLFNWKGKQKSILLATVYSVEERPPAPNTIGQVISKKLAMVKANQTSPPNSSINQDMTSISKIDDDASLETASVSSREFEQEEILRRYSFALLDDKDERILVVAAGNQDEFCLWVQGLRTIISYLHSLEANPSLHIYQTGSDFVHPDLNDMQSMKFSSDLAADKPQSNSPLSNEDDDVKNEADGGFGSPSGLNNTISNQIKTAINPQQSPAGSVFPPPLVSPASWRTSLLSPASFGTPSGLPRKILSSGVSESNKRSLFDRIIGRKKQARSDDGTRAFEFPEKATEDVAEEGKRF